MNVMLIASMIILFSVNHAIDFDPLTDPWLKPAATIILGVLNGFDFTHWRELSNEAYAVRAAIAFDLSVAMFAFAAPAVAVTKMWRQRIKLRRGQPFQSFTGEDGKDQAVMAHYYRDAERVVVVAGDFSWMRETEGNSDLRDRILKLAEAGKIQLVTYKALGIVSARMGEAMFERVRTCLREDSSKKGVKCSLVRYAGGRFAFLYRYSQERMGVVSSQASTEVRVGIVKDREETRYLLDVLRQLIEDEEPNMGAA